MSGSPHAGFEVPLPLPLPHWSFVVVRIAGISRQNTSVKELRVKIRETKDLDLSYLGLAGRRGVLPLLGQLWDELELGRKVRCHRRAVDFVRRPGAKGWDVRTALSSRTYPSLPALGGGCTHPLWPSRWRRNLAVETWTSQ